MDLQRSTTERDVFLVNEAPDPLPRILASCDALDAALGLPPQGVVDDAPTAPATGAAAGAEGGDAMGLPGAGSDAGGGGGDGRANIASSNGAGADACTRTAVEPCAGAGTDMSESEPRLDSWGWGGWLAGMQRQIGAAASAALASAASVGGSGAARDAAPGLSMYALDLEVPGAMAAAAVAAVHAAVGMAEDVAEEAAKEFGFVSPHGGRAACGPELRSHRLPESPGSAHAEQTATGSAGVAAREGAAGEGAAEGAAAGAVREDAAGKGAGDGSSGGGDMPEPTPEQAVVEAEGSKHTTLLEHAAGVDLPRLDGDGDGDSGYELVEPSAAVRGAAPRGWLRQPPLSADEWAAMLGADGSLLPSCVPALRARVFRAGVVPGVRPAVWKLLLGSAVAHEGTAAARVRRDAQAAEYARLRAQWQAITPDQAARFDEWRDRCARINKDVRRTDRRLAFFAEERGANVRALRRVLLSYAMHNFNLGYCQGMSDLAAPLLMVMCDEVDTFWAFAALMDRLAGHFDEGQSGVQAQLQALRELLQVLDPPLHAHLASLDGLSYFFCFRWLLVMFKREFSQADVLRLWEAAWACPFSPHLFVYLAAAVLVHHRRAIIDHCEDLDGVLKLCCRMPGTLQLEPLLALAEHMASCADTAGVDLSGIKGLPPPPPLAAPTESAASAPLPHAPAAPDN